MIKNQKALAVVTGAAPVGWALCREVKSRWFSFMSGHMPGLQVQSPSRGMYVRQQIDVSLSHQCFSPSLPNPLSKNK